MPDAAATRTLLLAALQRALAAEPADGAPPLPIPDPASFLRAVRRHRLAILLASQLETLKLTPELADALRREARHQQRAALPLIALALEILQAFERNGLRALLLKGPALAVQSGGQAWSRGSGDLDLFVAPADLPAAIAVLEGLGFERPPGQFPMDLASFWGRYARWAAHEISLSRPGTPWIDLHWALSNVRAPLPAFEEAWQRRRILPLNGRPVATLGLEDAFRHSCLHACVDDWMELRHLVDITRLATQLPPAERRRLRRSLPVRLSCAAAHEATGVEALLACTDLTAAASRRAIARARRSQLRPPRAGAEGPWHPGHWLASVLALARLSPSPIDWLRVVARFSLLPAAFNDPLTGRDLGLMGMLGARRRRLAQRLGERLSGSSPASARSAPEP